MCLEMSFLVHLSRLSIQQQKDLVKSRRFKHFDFTRLFKFVGNIRNRQVVFAIEGFLQVNVRMKMWPLVQGGLAREVSKYNNLNGALIHYMYNSKQSL